MGGAVMSALSTRSCSVSTPRRGRPLGPTALAIRSAAAELTSEFERLTVRQAFYRLAARGVVENSHGGYRQTQQQLLKMRREGALPWEFVADGTRW
jgi:hypothetical protein